MAIHSINIYVVDGYNVYYPWKYDCLKVKF